MKKKIFKMLIGLFFLQALFFSAFGQHKNVFIGGVDAMGKLTVNTGTRDSYYEIELLPQSSFIGSWYFWTTGASATANFTQNPQVDWLEISPSQFTDYGDGIATKVDYYFNAPAQAGVYTTVINDLQGSWNDMYIVLTVTETPTPNLTYNNIVPTHENFLIERSYTAPLYFFWEDVNQYYYFSGCLMINQHEQANKSWFNINPETICLDPGQSVSTHYTASFSQPLYDSVLVVRTRWGRTYPQYLRFVYDAKIMSVSRPVDLHTGWNLIGYSLSSPSTPAAAFAALINAGQLEMVTGYDQGGNYFDPNGPPFLNTLTEIQNGFGYWVKVNSNTSFIFPQ
jgi:hypothetical protein